MNKLILFLFFLCLNPINAKDTLPVANNNIKKFNQKNIKVDDSIVDQKTFEKNFKSKYTERIYEYQPKPKPENAWDRFKKWFLHIIKNLFGFSSNETTLNALGIIARILAFVLIIFVIYSIVKAIMNKEGSWVFGKSSDKKIINHQDVEKNIHSTNFEQLINKTLASGETRLTVRYYYLWLLKTMSDREIIVWDIEKTNSDYYYEIKNQSKKEEFGYLSYLYECIWYGEFELDNETFNKAQKSFQKAIQSY